MLGAGRTDGRTDGTRTCIQYMRPIHAAVFLENVRHLHMQATYMGLWLPWLSSTRLIYDRSPRSNCLIVQGVDSKAMSPVVVKMYDKASLTSARRARWENEKAVSRRNSGSWHACKEREGGLLCHQASCHASNIVSLSTVRPFHASSLLHDDGVCCLMTMPPRLMHSSAWPAWMACQTAGE